MSSADAARVASTCTELHDALYGSAGSDALMATTNFAPPDGSTLRNGCNGSGISCRGFHKRGDGALSALHLHALLPLGAVRTYVNAFRKANVEVLVVAHDTY